MDTLLIPLLRGALNLSCTANLPFGQQFIASEGPACLCEWQDENGVICGGIVTHANLPGHLSAHGIKNMRRDRLTKCKWAGCTKKPMNRESIARHVREVHMHLKRTPKREQESRL